MLKNKYFIVLLVVLSVVSADVALSSIGLSDSNGANDNPHNLSNLATHAGPKSQPVATGGTDQICIFCHTPHSAAPQSTLWSRPDPSTTTFPLYNTASGLVIRGNYPGSSGTEVISEYKNDGSVTYPSGSSRLCLSCHDGITAMNILNDGTWIAMVGGTDTLVGTQFQIDLSKSHPISFVYDTNVLAVINSLRGGTYQLPQNLTVFTPLDGDSKMQCTTCHDPHEDTRNEANYDGLPFWRHEGSGTSYADVCNACHIGGTPTGPTGDHGPVGPEI